MKLIYGKPMIWHMIERIKCAKKVSKIIVATSNNKIDDNFVKYLKKKEFEFFRGSLNNVAKRMFDVANKHKRNFFLRVSGDSPLIDPKIINKAISLFKKNKKYDIITNIFPRSFPKGQSVEIIKLSKLKNVIKYMNTSEKEHVTKYFYNNYKKFKIKNFKSGTLNNKTNLSVDTPSDLKFITRKYKKIFQENIKNYEN